jgi:uncharacterized protein YcbK (DUF882 family)
LTGRGATNFRKKARAFLGRAGLIAFAALIAVSATAALIDTSTARPEERVLKLLNVHTNERATIVFKRGGRYDRAGLKQINQILRDWRENEPTEMDPQLLDLLWQAYEESGSNDYIHVICGYRAPETNGMLRKRSSGVAKNSLHMQGKAIDFFIPGVELSKLRAIGLRMQAGGVGFYPKSGSPFVHMDTGSVRHWPRMSRQQLVAVFPRGHTIHVPSDGKPLPGYDQALAEYKARKASGQVVVASLAAEEPAPAGEPIVLASAEEDDEAEPRRAVAVASYATTPPPMPRLAPRHTTLPDPVAVASIATKPVPVVAVPATLPAPKPAAAPVIMASAEPAIGSLAPDFDFGPPQDWTSPAVPSALAQAMAERDQGRRGSSLPIPPTAVVATIEMSRPLRAAAITTAVLRTGGETEAPAPRVLAYAAAEAPAETRPVLRPVTASGMPLPVLSPRRATATAVAPAPARVIEPQLQADAPVLTMTALDTQGLRLWIGTASTRQKLYALLTMPDYTHSPELMAKPALSYGRGFGPVAYEGLRTDRFSGTPAEQPRMVQLTIEPVLTSFR